MQKRDNIILRTELPSFEFDNLAAKSFADTPTNIKACCTNFDKRITRWIKRIKSYW